MGCSNALVLNGDSFCSADVSPLVALHCKRGALCSILLVEVADVSRYGRVITDDEDNILLFEEKGSYSGSGFINAGIYLIEKRAFELAPASSRYSIEKELFPSLIGKGFYGYKAKEHNKDLIFIDIGTPESYKEASRLLKGFLPPNILP
ncbi:MAG: hypothetical protein D6808_03560 [Candidatus Dadabacteria bacterium]|nr:MAG: hypothetical protein D6808_03560 [Candidatus Dadabacteria bacterium]